MTRTSYRPVVALGLVAGLLAYVGCSSRPTRPVTGPRRADPRDVEAPAARATSARGSSSPTGRPRPGRWSSRASSSATSSRAAAPRASSAACSAATTWSSGSARAEVAAGPGRPGEPDQGPGRRPGRASSRPRSSSTSRSRRWRLMKYDALALSAEDLKVGVDEALGQFLNLPGEHDQDRRRQRRRRRGLRGDDPAEPADRRPGRSRSGSPPCSTPRRSRR